MKTKIIFAMLLCGLVSLCGCNANTVSDVVDSSSDSTSVSSAETTVDSTETSFQESEPSSETTIPSEEESNSSLDSDNVTETDSTERLVSKDGLCYTETDGTATVVGWEIEPVDLVIPTEIDGIPVSAVANNAFYECKSIQSLTVPNTVKMIGQFAFYKCNNLSDISISLEDSEIGKYAFCGCPGSPVEYSFDPDVEVNTKDIEVQDGYEYGEWVTVDSIDSDTPIVTEATDVRRTLSNGYEFVPGEGGVTDSAIVYHYIIQERTKEPKIKIINVTTYNYSRQETENGETVVQRYYNQSSIPNDI